MYWHIAGIWLNEKLAVMTRLLSNKRYLDRGRSSGSQRGNSVNEKYFMADAEGSAGLDKGGVVDPTNIVWKWVPGLRYTRSKKPADDDQGF